MPGKWLVMQPKGVDVHVIPEDDTELHFEFPECHCKPRVEEQSNQTRLVIHNSFDCREFAEWPRYGSSANSCAHYS